MHAYIKWYTAMFETFSFAKMTKEELSQKASIDRFTGIWWLEKDKENL